MADTDLIARVYPFDKKSEFEVTDDFRMSSYYVAPRIRPTRSQVGYRRGERELTEPLPDRVYVPDYYYLPCIELRLSDVPRSRHGIVFGTDPNSDVVLPNHRALSYHHFSLTFDKANRLIVKDWDSHNGTEVTYDDRGHGVRSGFQWIVGGHDVPKRRCNIVITLPSEPPIKLKIIVAQHNIQSPEYVDKVDRFCQGSATAQDLFAGLDIPKRQDTRRPTGAHTPGTGDIHLTKVLGQGSFAVVTHYWNVSTGEEHALKEPSRKAIRERLFHVDEWENEKHVMGLISHHNIVQLLGSNFTGLPRLYLEYVPGGSLADQQDISTAECVLILRQCLSALEYLHAMQIVHRDIKAENILVQYRTSDHIEVKLADFGLSKDNDNLSTICGNRKHLAPEICYNEQLTQAGVEGRKSYNSAVDIWSLGTTIYGLLCCLPEWKESYIFRGTRWAEKIVDRFGKDCTKQPDELKCFLLQAMVVIGPEERWSAQACLREAENLRLAAQSRHQTPTPNSPAGRGERRAIRDQGEQSTIVPIRRPISSRIASDSMAARRFIGSGAPSLDSMQASRKRPTTVSTSSSSLRRQSKRRRDRGSTAQSASHVTGSHTHHSGQKRRDSDAQARTRYSTNRLLSHDSLEVNSSPTALSRLGGDNLAQDDSEDQELVDAAVLLQQMGRNRSTNLYVRPVN
ncbi:kinase-like protein [Amniculicola lignicola CBS 123094]|uniref:Kinase-like protein n=1 Tax=Amniculicola lignicola CBS 123094 TaxID=1392246 RepID=A0A6A5VWU2_9PLEO|nr:kinase-like protein [Amniculicola lignicola CBS 123094]